MFLNLDERNAVRLTTAKRLSSPETATKFCNCPMFQSGRLIMEYSICMEVPVHSQPQRLFDTRMYTAAQRQYAVPQIKNAARILMQANFVFPYLVQRKISSAPV